MRVRPFPVIVEAIRRAAADPYAGVSDVVRLLEADVGIATDLLRIANAPTSALSQKCRSIRHAASLLGLKRVVELVATAAALSYVEKTAVEFPELGTHALGVAGVARALAPITGLPPDETFTAGLLHDVGVLLLVESDDPFYVGLLESAGDIREPSVVDERALMGFDHATLGAAVARAWNFPNPLPQVIALHHDWDAALKVGGATCAMVALLRAAEALLPMLSVVSVPSLDELSPIFEEPAFGHLGLTRQETHRLWEALRRAGDPHNLLAIPDAAGVDQDLTRGLVQRPPPLVTVPMVVSEASSPGGAPVRVAAASVLIVAGTLGMVALLTR